MIYAFYYKKKTSFKSLNFTYGIIFSFLYGIKVSRSYLILNISFHINFQRQVIYIYFILNISFCFFFIGGFIYAVRPTTLKHFFFQSSSLCRKYFIYYSLLITYQLII
jgi:hypothetical protein